MVKNPIKPVAYPSMTTAPPAPLTNPMYASMFSCSQNVQQLRQTVAFLWPPCAWNSTKLCCMFWGKPDLKMVVQN